MITKWQVRKWSIKSNIDKCLMWIMWPISSARTKRLMVRRGGFVSHLRLQRTFKKISKDPWVKRSRIIYSDQHNKNVL